MKRLRPITPELLAAIEIQNKANLIAKVVSKKPRAVRRAEDRSVARELKHDAQMTTKQRSYFERTRQALLTIARAKNAARKRANDILQGVQDKEQVTALGVVLPSGRQVGDILSKVK